MEQLKSPLAARNIPKGVKSCVVHGYGSWFDAIGHGRHDFFTKLMPKLTREGITPYLVEGDSRTSRALLLENHLHIIVGGPAMFGPTILHAYPSYLWGFWYFDELGHGANSSLRFSRFPEHEVDREQADYFFNGVTGFMLRENVSKLGQEPRMDAPLRPATATILCQAIENETPRTHYLTTKEMIVTAAEFDRDAVVYVKPHPHQGKLGRRHILEICADHPNVKVSDASIHDLIEAARVVITQNSSAGFEALMQRKPVVTCGKSDYWHATLTPRNISELRDAIGFGPETMSSFDYAGYFNWFLEKQCLEPAKDNFAPRAWARVRDKLILD
ncbi:MAG: hypothetical protein KJ731_20690 [Alphaproteobacteria bacterium]|nr:hypothetical protein [Alphaproteobacteria bacterium]MBU1278753.1 hypothetical protein [Alphaproteobacteria bacterium]MBU1571956.1 hypothetical protein [Alphaproteobacteria bacterium]MBU1830870.1 hypothetical protein [Alphaproteobacteria bacterium]MBU2078195.1 hypothetical protein [Alphaproteobacteria bacterium]